MDKMILSVLLLGVCISFSEIQLTKAKKTKITYIKCIKGDPFRNSGYHSERKNIKWAKICGPKTCDFTTIVQGCAMKALANNIHTFAVNFYGNCRAANTNYYEPGECTGIGSSIAIVGGADSSAVYHVEEFCDSGQKKGTTWYVPETPEKCQRCSCNNNYIDSCYKMTCDYPFKCEKFNPAQKNKCCRECACHHNGVDKKEGEEWADRRKPGICRQCKCVQGRANCPVQACPTDCPKPEYIPGQCCPRCSPKAPTTRPWETLPPTRARPTFPPWLLGKRISRKRFEWSSLKQY